MACGPRSENLVFNPKTGIGRAASPKWHEHFSNFEVVGKYQISNLDICIPNIIQIHQQGRWLL